MWNGQEQSESNGGSDPRKTETGVIPLKKMTIMILYTSAYAVPNAKGLCKDLYATLMKTAWETARLNTTIKITKSYLFANFSVFIVKYPGKII